MRSELTRYDNFEFKGDVIPLLADDRGRFVSFSRLCHLLSLDPAAEWVELQRRAMFAAGTRVDFDPRSGEPRYYIEVGMIPAWMMQVATDKLPPHLRAKHTAFATELGRAVYDFTAKGVAIKDGTPLLAVLKEVGDYALSLNPSDRMRLVVSSAIESEMLRIAGRPGGGEAPVSVAYRCQKLGLRLSQADVQEIGRLAAKEYRRRHGRPPKKFPQFIDGAQREVNDYREADVPLIDAVIDSYLKRRSG